MSNDNIVGCIICEDTIHNVEFKLQSENKNGFVIAEGVLQRGNEINRNKRYYPVEELKRAVNSPRQKELVESGNFKGEAGHPLDKSLARQSKVDPQCEQVWYTKLWMEGDTVKGHFRGTNNDLGRSFNDDLKDGQLPSFSLRALGSVVNENGRLTVRNLQMVAYDRVYFPSHPGAYTSKIISMETNANENSRGLVHESFGGLSPLRVSNGLRAKLGEIGMLKDMGNDVESVDTITRLTQDEVNNFILSESANVRNAINAFDIFYESMEIDPRLDRVAMTTRLGDRVHLMLETAVSREIMNGVVNYL